MRLTSVTAAINTNRTDLRPRIARADINQTIPKYGPRNNSVTITHFDSPQLAASRRIVTNRPLGSWNNRLPTTCVVNHQGRAKRPTMNAVRVVDCRTRSFPYDLPRQNVESHHELLIRAIARQNHHITVQCR